MSAPSRREILQFGVSGVAAMAGCRGTFLGSRPAAPFGVQLGDVQRDRAVVWSRSDRPARLIVEWSTDEKMRNARRIEGPVATPETDLTARLLLRELPADATVHLRVSFTSPEGRGPQSDPIVAHLRTAPATRRDVFLAWSGDTCGQGYGIDRARGGMRIYETIRRAQPDLFIHSGDMIYADNPLVSELPLPDGTMWRNFITDEKRQVAETLEQFRGQHRYNMHDENVRAMYSEVPLLVQWDDHDLRNNWYPTQVIDDPRYKERRADVLWRRARRAFCEYVPLDEEILKTALADQPPRIYRSIPYGPLVEIFLIDERSYRGRNTNNLQEVASAETTFLGREQLDWLKGALKSSQALWKVIATDMPLALLVSDPATGPDAQEGWANGGGPPRGRELELAELLRHLRDQAIRNVVFITADVHYAAAHQFDPGRAQFTEFLPFWEFIAGPLHAGCFGPNPLDPTFGPRVVWQNVPAGPFRAAAPTEKGRLNFGTLKVEGKTGVLTVAWQDVEGQKLHEIVIPPAS